MKLAKVTVIATALLLGCQLLAQQGQLTSVQKVAAQAKVLGRALPIMPTAPPRHMRSFLWVGEQVTPYGKPPAPPSSCNKIVNGHYLFCPPSLEIAYGTPSILGANGGAGTVIAITDAFHYAAAESDLNFFSNDMGLPACTTGNGCFTQVDQNGGKNFCGSDSGWELETMLDIEWAHAMAPNAKIVLVEGCTNQDTDLNTAIKTAVTKFNADIVSNSWGEDEFPGETGEDANYNLGKPLFFSSGDAGAPAIYPCQSPYATCIGGTNLQVDANFHRVTETGWTGSGGGCSLYEALPTYQSANGVTLCSPHRAAPDVSAVADPNTGVAVYDSGNGGYFRVGGTSVASPVAAAAYADVLTARVGFGKSRYNGQFDTAIYNAFTGNYKYFYYDVVSGNNGHSAGPGYDLITGIGVPYWTAAANRFFGLP
jgi:subtilase family serine protease